MGEHGQPCLGQFNCLLLMKTARGTPVLVQRCWRMACWTCCCCQAWALTWMVTGWGEAAGGWCCLWSVTSLRTACKAKGVRGPAAPCLHARHAHTSLIHRRRILTLTLLLQVLRQSTRTAVRTGSSVGQRAAIARWVPSHLTAIRPPP